MGSASQTFIVRRGDAQRRRNAANALMELPDTDDWEIKISKHRCRIIRIDISDKPGSSIRQCVSG